MRVNKVGDKQYVARVGDFFGPSRPTPSSAIEGLDKELETYHPLNHDYIRCNDGTVFHLLQVPSHGWSYRIIESDGYHGKGVGVGGTFQQAKERAMNHAKEHGGIVG